MTATLDLRADADDQQLLGQVVAYYQRTLQNSPEALAYLSSHGLGDGQAIEQFRIGYADRSLGLTLPVKQVKAGKAIRDRLQEVGLFRASGHEHFNGCVVFPIMAGDGSRRIVDIYGRKILGLRLLKRCPQELHLNDQRQGVWNVEAFGATEEIILCPSLFDALTFWTHGYRNVTCMFGPDALTADLLAAFEEFSIKRILTPCEGITPRLLEAGLDCFLLRFPSGLDANAYACQSPIRGKRWGPSCARPSGLATARQPRDPSLRLLPWKNKCQHRFQSQCWRTNWTMLTLKTKPRRHRLRVNPRPPWNQHRFPKRQRSRLPPCRPRRRKLPPKSMTTKWS